MSPVFVKIFQQAEKTFSLLNKDAIRTNLTILKKLVDSLEFKHLNINPQLTSKRAFQGQVSGFTIAHADLFNNFIFVGQGSVHICQHLWARKFHHVCLHNQCWIYNATAWPPKDVGIAQSDIRQTQNSKLHENPVSKSQWTARFARRAKDIR